MSSIKTMLKKSIRAEARYNPDAQIAPLCILWPDKERQWESAINQIAADIPELLIFGEYNTQKRTGPAIWMRCVLANKITDIHLPEDLTPILYLPGISRQDLRAVESCPDNLKPLAELQYLGNYWSQQSGRDWTILAYLKSDRGGLNLDVAQDNEAKIAMQRALNKLIKEDVEQLRGKFLDTAFLNMLLTSGDPVKDILLWLDSPENFQTERSEAEVNAFAEVCKSTFNFKPLTEGVLSGATRLANHQGSWQAIWQRYCEAPSRYENIPNLIRQCNPPSSTLEWHSPDATFDGWPQWNDDQELILRRELHSLLDLTPTKARQKILDLDRKHAHRRELVWTELGQSPLAQSLEHLSILADMTQSYLTAGSISDLVVSYHNFGWKADSAVLAALKYPRSNDDIEVVIGAIRSVYTDWLEESARYLQNALQEYPYPGGTVMTATTEVYKDGDCLLFVDGLRFDLGKQMAALLKERNLDAQEEIKWSALPSVTATGKPAITPVRHLIWGTELDGDFEPVVADSSQSLRGGYQLKKILKESGWRILENTDNGNGQGLAWCEYSNIDHEGHDRGWKLANHVDALLMEISDRVSALLSAGWRRVRIVTDHGWLLLPGDLPKVELASALTENKWGRCAVLKPGSVFQGNQIPWYWNPNYSFVFANGISCFKVGEEYTHGGISLQECLLLNIIVKKNSQAPSSAAIEITDVGWKGLRCSVGLLGTIADLKLDLRLQAADIHSSVAVEAKPFKDSGVASVVIENEDLEGREVFIVILDETGKVIKQLNTVIGG